MKLLLDVYKGAAKDLRDKVEVKNQDLFDFFLWRKVKKTCPEVCIEKKKTVFARSRVRPGPIYFERCEKLG